MSLVSRKNGTYFVSGFGGLFSLACLITPNLMYEQYVQATGFTSTHGLLIRLMGAMALAYSGMCFVVARNNFDRGMRAAMQWTAGICVLGFYSQYLFRGSISTMPPALWGTQLLLPLSMYLAYGLPNDKQQ